MQFLDVFQPVEKGNTGLTDEIVYKSIQQGGGNLFRFMVPVKNIIR